MRPVAWLVVAAMGVSCALPSFDEYARPLSATPGPDGGSSSGGSDASVMDGSVTMAKDAATDGAIGAPCPRTAVYCNDFSSGKVEDVADDEYVEVTPPSSILIEDGILHAKVVAAPQSDQLRAIVARTLSTTGMKATLEVDVNMAASDWGTQTGSTIILFLAYESMPRRAMELYVERGDTIVTTSLNGDLLYDTTSVDLTRGQTVHVKLESDFTTHAGSMRLSFNGQVVAHRENIDFAPANGPLRFGIGLARTNAPTPLLDLKYDNLVITLP